MTSPESQYKSLILSTSTITTTTLSEINSIYDALKPINPDFLIGEWKGGALNAPFNVDHPSHVTLMEIGWAGKRFGGVEDVDPIMVYDKEGKRVFMEKWGHARLRKVEFRGVVSTAMIYDDFPIIDSFRYVDEDLVAGFMDFKGTKPYHFYLERLKME